MHTIKRLYTWLVLYASQLAYKVKSKQYNRNWLNAFRRQHRDGLALLGGFVWFFSWLAFWLVCLGMLLK